MHTILTHGNRALSRVGWNADRHHPTAGNAGLLACGCACATLVGYLAGNGHWVLALAVVAVPVFVFFAITTPERTTLGLLVALPFLVYPASVGRFSIHLGIPMFGFTALMLMTRQHGSLHKLRRVLPVSAFALLLTIATLTAGVSSDTATAFSRVFYLALFGGFAWALATALVAGRLSREAVARAIVYGAALAATALLVQFFAQFGAGQEGVVEWLRGVQTLFAGERTAGITTVNWTVEGLDVLRGIFPFMTPPVAGQYLMLALIAGVWLRRERKAIAPAQSALELVLLIVIGAALLATLSRQAWVGAAVGMVALGVGQRRQWTIAVIVAFALLVLVAPVPGGHGSFGDYLLSASDTSTMSSAYRVTIWGQAVALIPDHAIIGVGPGLIQTLSPDPDTPVFYAHNLFLDTTVELGIAGGLALIALFVLALRSALRRSATLAFALLTAYVVANLFDDAFYTPRTGLLLAAVFALIAGARTERSGSATSLPDRRVREPAHSLKESSRSPVQAGAVAET